MEVNKIIYSECEEVLKDFPDNCINTIITDPARVQEIKESITEGELILKVGKSNNRKLSAEELIMVQRSVDNAKQKIGLEVPKINIIWHPPIQYVNITISL